MNYTKLLKLKEKLYFNVNDVSENLSINSASAKVLCCRYVKNGIFLRLKNNFYVFKDGWENYTTNKLLQVSNILQVPSYVSFMTALSIHNVTTQVQREFFENASLKRTTNFDIQGVVFNFYKLKKGLYFAFEKKNDIFMATKEKAFLDAIYLYSLGKYKIDLSSIDIGKLNIKEVKNIMRVFPNRTKNIIKKLCKI
ncbi:MAG: hypothetical protein AB1755_04230 [Candidatus Omnitrophota bacterium]